MSVGCLIGLYVGGIGLLRHRGPNLLGAVFALSLIYLGELLALGLGGLLGYLYGCLGLERWVPPNVAYCGYLGFALAGVVVLPMAIFDAAATTRKTTIPPLQG